MRIITILMMLMFSINLFSQSFPRDMPELLLGKTVTPVKKSANSINNSITGYYYFIKKFDKKRKTYSSFKNVPFSSDGITSDYDKLFGKEFKVISIYELDKKYASRKEYILELENTELGIIFYKYDSRSENSFELDVKDNLDFPEDFYCKELINKKDKFENEESFFTPNLFNLNLSKTIKNEEETFMLIVDVLGETLNIGEKGVFILFENGEKIIKPDAEIDVDSSMNTSGWTYTAYIILSKDEINLIKDSKITDVKLFIYNSEILEKTSYKIQEYLKCMTK